MHILLTNDDGIFSDGLNLMAEALREAGHEVWISAPDSERSAFSQAITLRHPVKFHEIRPRVYSCSGTPADCIFYGLKGAVPIKPDLVISGINRGFNVGTDIIYSGTVGAAREAALHNIPAIAVSAEGFEPPFPFRSAALFTAEHLEAFVGLWNPEILININVPHDADGRWDVGYPERRDYGDSIEPLHVDEKMISYVLAAKAKDHKQTFIPNKNSDMELLSRQIISVTPVHIHPVMENPTAGLLQDLAIADRKRHPDA